MKEWWDQLNQRERHYLLSGSLFLLSIFIYFLIWSPFSNAMQNLRNNVAYNRQLVSWMEKAELQLQSLPASHKRTQTISANDLLSSIAQSLTNNKMMSFTPQVQQSAANKVKVSFATVPFDTLIHWLIALQKKHALQIATFAASHQDKSGMVQATVVLYP